MFRAASLLKSATTAAVCPQQWARKNFVKNWLSDSSTYPIMIIVGAAAGVMAMQCTRIVTNHPDIRADKDERQTYIQDNDGSAAEYFKHGIRMSSVNRETTEIFPAFNEYFVNKKLKELENKQ